MGSGNTDVSASSKSHKLQDSGLRQNVSRSLVQVVGNLLDNAAKFAGREILVTAGEMDGMAAVEVRDDGPGIAPDLFPVLFTKFSGKSQGGTGLGLFICRGIIEAHSGSISISNSAQYGSGGATFRFTVPMAPKDSA